MQVKLIAGIALLVFVFGSGLYIKILRAENKALTLQVEKAVKERVEVSLALTTCQEDQKIASEVSTEYQGKLADITRQLNAVKRLRNKPQCAPIKESSSCGYNATSGAGKHVGADGISVEWLADYAALAEQYRQQVIALQSYINQSCAAPVK